MTRIEFWIGAMLGVVLMTLTAVLVVKACSPEYGVTRSVRASEWVIYEDGRFKGCIEGALCND